MRIEVEILMLLLKFEPVQDITNEYRVDIIGEDGEVITSIGYR